MLQVLGQIQNRIWLAVDKTLYSFQPITRLARSVVTPGVRRAFAGANGMLDFMTSGNEFWTTDGQVAKRVASLPAYVAYGASRSPGSYVFSAAGPPRNDDRELWALDAGQTQCALVADMYPGTRTASAQILPRGLGFADEVYFAPLRSTDLWSSRGTASSTRSRFSNATFAVDPIRVEGRVLFTGGLRGFAAFDATTGPATVLAFAPNQWGEFSGRAGRRALLGVRDSQQQTTSLHLTDGTAAGTRLLASLAPSVSSTVDLFGSDEFLILARDRLLRSDGTAQGTRSVLPLRTESWSRLARCGRVCLFQARDALGLELWITDGSASGTRRLVDIWPGAASSNPSGFLQVGRYVYFAADDGVTGRELWRSDGTAAGTQRVLDHYPGGLGSDPEPLVRIGPDRLVFAAFHPSWGREVFESDGSAAGTRLLANIHAAHDSWPTRLGRLGDSLIVAADDGVHGQELHRIHLGASSWQSTLGCFDARENTLDASRPRIGQTQRVMSSAYALGSVRALVVGVPRGARSSVLADCEAAWDLARPIWIADAWIQGVGAQTTAIPILADMTLVGLQYALQSVTLAPGLRGGLALSHGVECAIGR